MQRGRRQGSNPRPPNENCRFLPLRQGSNQRPPNENLLWMAVLSVDQINNAYTKKPSMKMDRGNKNDGPTVNGPSFL